MRMRRMVSHERVTHPTVEAARQSMEVMCSTVPYPGHRNRGLSV